MNWKVSRFTTDDFKNADRIERIYMAVVQSNDFSLNNDDSVYLDILTKAYPIICSKPEEEALQLIAHLEGGKWNRQIEAIYRDAQRLYDNFMISKEMIKGIAIRQLMLIAGDMQANTKLFDDENAIARAGDVARKSWESVLKYAGVANLDENPKLGPLPIPTMQKLPVHSIYERAEIVENDTGENLDKS